MREKASLAYYATSRVESHDGLLMVMSGIDAQNYDQAVTIIKNDAGDQTKVVHRAAKSLKQKQSILPQLRQADGYSTSTSRALCIMAELTGKEMTPGVE